MDSGGCGLHCSNFDQCAVDLCTKVLKISMVTFTVEVCTIVVPLPIVIMLQAFVE